jgi:hypothetical protein
MDTWSYRWSYRPSFFQYQSVFDAGYALGMSGYHL